MSRTSKRAFNLVKAEELHSQGASFEEILSALEFHKVDETLQKYVTDRDSDYEGHVIPNDSWEFGYVFGRYDIDTGERKDK